MQGTPPIKTKYSIRYSNFAIGVLVLLCSLFLIQCKKNTTTFSPSSKLTFSTKQLFFDTVFTTIGSSVRVFVVHNNNSEAVNVSTIRVQGYYPSYFNINIDGTPGTSFSNVKIPANDSIYVFATVTVNPTNQNAPLVIQDSLVFTTNGNVQSVQLVAFGQDAYFYVPNVFPSSGPAYYQLPCGSVWKSDKPHVIFGYLLVPSGCSLSIDSGSRVYLHDSAVVIVSSGATLNVAGMQGHPVTFQGDRLEPEYKYIPGQWNTIFLAPGSINNTISWAVIQNGTTGVQADTVGNSSPTLIMDHTIIKGMSSYGLLGAGATIQANNCVIADCQNNCVAMFYGGDYHYYQCTFANYWGVVNSYGQRTNPVVYMNNGYQSFTGKDIPRALTNAYFGNCIIYGPLDEEVGMDSNFLAPFNYYFKNCVFKTQRNYSQSYHYGDSNWVTDPLFYNPGIDDYHVSGGSPALLNANSIISNAYNTDLDGGNRPNTNATIGAYEQ